MNIKRYLLKFRS